MIATARAPRQDATSARNQRCRTLGTSSDPNGMVWDAVRRTLYLSDHGTGQVVPWTEAGGLGTPFAIAPGAGLGQPVLNRGDIVVPRFGLGRRGGIVRLDRDSGKTAEVPGLDPSRWRVALTSVAGDLVVGWFTGHGESRRGAVARVDPTEGERDVVSGLVKPVGLAVSGRFLYVSDQALGLVLRAPLASLRRPIALTSIEGVDALCPGPDGDGVFAATGAGTILWISTRGKVQTMADGFARARGLAWDQREERLFVAHRATSGAIALSILSPRP